VQVVLSIKTGPFTGKEVEVRAGASVVIGRTVERTRFAVPHDYKMSSVHFAVECGPNGCRVFDKKSSNGTFLNGARIQEAVLANGDEIKSGQTIFAVHIFPDGQFTVPASDSATAPPESPNPVAASTRIPSAKSSAGPPTQPLQLAIGGWAFHKIPERWQIQEGIGIQQVVKDGFPASIRVTEEPMGASITLPLYVEAHTKMFREHLPQPNVGAIAPPAIHGSEETAALDIRFTIKDGPAVFWRRIYVRSGSTMGVLMLTALEKDISSVQAICDSVLSAISFVPKAPA
jgi:pSer/pThr/pTyr-binding forkhead associated (FHA) protein